MEQGCETHEALNVPDEVFAKLNPSHPFSIAWWQRRAAEKEEKRQKTRARRAKQREEVRSSL
jgi:hypothetical protein